MAISIQGMDRLISRLDKLSRIETKKIINEVGTDVEKSIRNKASFSNAASYIGKCKARQYGNSYFLDVGLSSDTAPFEQWKQLWFHNLGYFNHGLNFTGQYYINNHALWFDKAIQEVEGQAIAKIKNKLKQEIKAFKN